MDRISPSLQARITAAGPASTQLLELIVTVKAAADWEEGVRLLAEAGLKITGKEKAVRVVYGRAAVKDIPHLAAIPAVQLVEPESKVRALK